MSDVTTQSTALPEIWRLKKAADGSVYGPVDAGALKEWANSAQISPSDEIDASDDKWRPAPDIDFLFMTWIVRLPENEVYGPTSVGTLREFLREGIIQENTLVKSSINQQQLPLAALLASDEMEQRRAQKLPPKEKKAITAEIGVEMAKDQRIRQLEEDLRQLRGEHEGLLQKYRQLTLQIQEGGKGAPRILPPPIR